MDDSAARAETEVWHAKTGVHRRVLVPLLVAVLSLTVHGCVNRQSADISPGADLTGLESFYVVKFAPDGRGINRLIADELSRRGYKASTGLKSDAPADVDALVTYRDKWMWDITMYMIELNITMRDPKTEYPMATGNSYHTSLTRLSPEEMVAEVLSNMFKEARAGTGETAKLVTH